MAKAASKISRSPMTTSPARRGRPRLRFTVRIPAAIFAKKNQESLGAAGCGLSRLGAPQFLQQERPGISPHAISSSGRNAQGLGRLLGREPGEEPQLDEFRGLAVPG